MRIVLVKGGVIPLSYTLETFAALEKKIGYITEWDAAIYGDGDQRGEITDTQADNVYTFLAELGNTGLKEQGLSPVLTPEWVKKHAKPSQYRIYQAAIVNAISEGNALEEKEEPEEIDLTLQELKKVKGAEIFHPAKSAPTL